MEPVVTASALKHGLAEADIVHAFNNALYFVPEEDGFTLLVGPDRAARFIELGVVRGWDGIPVIVHAMKARPRFIG